MAQSNDIDLMLRADGELAEGQAREVDRVLAEDETARAKIEGIAQVGDTLRTYLELETDAAAETAPFDGLWSRIEQGIQAQEVRAAAGATAIRKKPGAAEHVDSEPVAGLAAAARWFRGWKGHAATGLVAAGAVAALMLALRPEPRVVLEVTPARLESQPPEVGNLEVYDGSGMILTIPGDGDGGSTAVIWISSEHDTVEGPI
jgi:hypothetical protein